MKITQIAGIFSLGCRAFFIIFLFIAVFKVGSIYGKYNEGESVINFFSTDKKYEIGFGNEIPVIVKEQVASYNSVVRTVWLCLFSLFSMIGFQYFEDPKEHFITKIIGKFKGGLEDNV